MADDRIANPWEKPARPVAPVYSGTAGRLFFLALRYMALTIVTFGIGRFWMATRLRQHYWSSVTIGDAPMEYTGRAKEKLIGFLIAVVILAAVLFVANLALALIGLLVFKQPFIAFQLSFVVLVPLGFWAQYRARRYIMARTRWRGIRFGVEPAAWRYAGAALGWWALVILTLGLLYPLMQLRLSRFLTDRSYFGDLRFEQKARLRPLFLSWMRVWAPLAVFLAWFVVFPLISGEELNEMYIDSLPGIMLLLGTCLLIWLWFAHIAHRVFSFRYLASTITLGGETRAHVTIGTWAVIRIYVIGAILIGLCAAGAAMILGVIGSVIAGFGFSLDSLKALAAGQGPEAVQFFVLVAGAVAYLPMVAVYVALHHAFIRHPMLREVTDSTSFFGLEAAGRAKQRAHDEQAEAGGFADALGADIGGAF